MNPQRKYHIPPDTLEADRGVPQKKSVMKPLAGTPWETYLWAQHTTATRTGAEINPKREYHIPPGIPGTPRGRS